MTNVDDGRLAIALTIDDGPSPVYTPQILRLLDKYQVTATFSMIGLEVDAQPGIAREVAAAGHIIANHTWAHPDLAFLSRAVIADQINRAAGAIHQATGRAPTLFRAPYGAWSPGRPPVLRAGQDDPARLVRRPPRLVPPRRSRHRPQHHA
jgi:peptidoglycan-N-acetylglucosamine deacetylase